MIFARRRNMFLLLLSMLGAFVVSKARAGGCGWGSCLVPRRTLSSGWHAARSPGGNTLLDIMMNNISSMSLFGDMSLFQQDATNRMQRAAPRCTFQETHDQVTLSLDVPGIDAKDLSVRLEEEGTVLRVRGVRHYEQQQQQQQQQKDGNRHYYHQQERMESKFDQEFRLDPSNVRVDKCAVVLTKGVLKISIPKKKKKQEHGREIPIMTPSNSKTTTQQQEQVNNGPTKHNNNNENARSTADMDNDNDDDDDLTILDNNTDSFN